MRRWEPGTTTRAEDVTADWSELSHAAGGGNTTKLFIRATHPNAFRSGQWAEVLAIEYLYERHGDHPRPARPVLRVRWVDGVTDLWAAADEAAGYEFAGGVR